MMKVEVKFEPRRHPYPYTLYLGGHYFGSYPSEEEARRAAEREQRSHEDSLRRKEFANARPPLAEWTIDEILRGYSPYDAHNYTTDELNAELARRFNIAVTGGKNVADILLERGLIDRETWERITDFWDSGMAY
jgi:hypothetical protein